MDAVIESDGSTVVIRAAGRLDGTNAADGLAVIQQSLTDTDTALILDLGGVIYVSSAGLRVFLMVAKDTHRSRVRFALCSLQEPVKDVMRIAGFDQMINVYDSLPEGAECGYWPVGRQRSLRKPLPEQQGLLFSTGLVKAVSCLS